MPELDRMVVKILPHQFWNEGPTVLTQYLLTNLDLLFKNESEFPTYQLIGFITLSHYTLLFLADPSQGICMKIVLKRRLMNELLTTYLPTVLILIIVYITNFFKTFFFEAVVTVNLTALLVLTTLFISVSGSLPPTAYVKMVDLWLIFAQMIPFFEVLLHTGMDMKRNDGDREINHHGTSINVGSNDDDEFGLQKVLTSFSYFLSFLDL